MEKRLMTAGLVTFWNENYRLENFIYEIRSAFKFSTVRGHCNRSSKEVNKLFLFANLGISTEFCPFNSPCLAVHTVQNTSLEASLFHFLNDFYRRIGNVLCAARFLFLK